MGAFERATATLGAFVDRWRGSMNLPGVAVAITDRDRDLHVGVHGVADLASGRSLAPEHLHEIGSVSKSFTALAVLRAVEEGRVGLDDPVAAFLPWPRPRGGPRRPGQAPPITVRHLLTHTSGLVQGTEAVPDAAGEVWSLRGHGAGPGRRFHYSNAGYKALGLVLEQVAEQACPEVIRRWVLDPLGMDAADAAITNATRPRLATGHEPFRADRPLPPGGPLAPATWLETATADGSIASTASDLARYVRLLLTGGRHPAPVVSPEMFALMTRPAVAMPYGLGPPSSYGLGTMVFDDDGATVIGHSGGMVGYTSHVLADPAAGVGIVVLTNGPGGCRRIAWYGLRLARAALAGDDPPVPPMVDPYHVPEAAFLAGRYAGGTLSLALEAAGGGLLLRHAGARIPVARRGGGLLADGAPFELFPFGVLRDGGAVAGLTHGRHRLAKDGATLPPARPHPARWEAFGGHYRSHNPWFTNFRVVLRGGELVLIAPGGSEAPPEEERLVPRGGGEFRAGEDPGSPEWVRFGAFSGGRALRCTLSGADYWRTVTP